MAITPTNSNTTSIINLPKAQIAVGSDLLILQTTNGTQTITFDKFNVVKTDVIGNATVVNNLSVTNTNSVGYFNSIAVNVLTASSIHTAAGPGVTLPSGFYNQFSVQNGLILSATQNVFNDPVYVQLYNNDIPQFVQGQLTSTGVTPVIQRSGTVIIPAGNVSYVVTLDNFFSNPPNSYIAAGSITPAHFNLTTDFIPTTVSLTDYNPSLKTSALSSLSVVYIPNSVQPIITPYTIASTSSSDGTNTALTFTITIGTPQLVDVTVYWVINVVAPLKKA